MNTMKTILVYGLKNVVGGIENYLMLMHSQLHKELKFIFLVENAKDFIYARQISDNEGEIVYLPDRHSINKYINSYKQVLDDFRNQSDTLYVNVGHISFDILPINIALKKGYKVVTHSHSAMQEPIQSLFHKFRQRLLHKIGVWRLKYLNVERLAVSQRAGKYLYDGKPFRELSPGIDIKRFVYDESKNHLLRTKFSFDQNVVLGFVGRLVAVKNPLFLIDVLYETKRLIPSVKMIVIGDGDLREVMEERVKKKSLEKDIVFVGEVCNVDDYYNIMDILLLPSLSEGLPFVTIEAQSVGVPCICAKDNIPDAVNVSGYVLFPSLNEGPSKWAKEILKSLSVSYDKNSMHQSVQQSDYNITNAAKKLLDILK